MDLDEAHKASSSHEGAIRRSDLVGCFYCCKTFHPSEIGEWHSDPSEMGLRDGRTALCPHCGIDAVLPGAVIPLNDDFLHAMKGKWF